MYAYKAKKECLIINNPPLCISTKNSSNGHVHNLILMMSSTDIPLSVRLKYLAYVYAALYLIFISCPQGKTIIMNILHRGWNKIIFQKKNSRNSLERYKVSLWILIIFQALVLVKKSLWNLTYFFRVREYVYCTYWPNYLTFSCFEI